MIDLVGRTLKGRYRIEALIGRGGMAEVYKAWDLRRQHHVAVKVMREDLAEDVEFLRRFRREAEALAALAHENIVRFYSFERDGRLAFIVMGYVEGSTLRGRILDAEEQPLPLDEALSVARQVCAALHYAHGENVLHRDVKPGNIMIRPDSLVLVADFGIAKAADAATATTVMPGTPAYMSPEQCRSEPLDPRTDVYSLGIVVYEMLAGRRPFVGDTHATTGSTRERIRWEQVHADPPPLRGLNPGVPPGVEAAVLKALAKEPGDRWPSVLAFWQALEKALGSAAEPVPAAAAVPVAMRPIASPQQQRAAVRSVAQQGATSQPLHQPAQRVALPPWAWVAGGTLLAAMVIVAFLLLSRPTPEPPLTATPTEVVIVQVTTSVPAPGSTATATQTPTPTHTPHPADTHTPTATDTAYPTDTHTPIATDTAQPTDTHTPTATDTHTPVVPTDTPRPTRTPSPLPTRTPIPPTATPDQGADRIAFASYRDGNSEIYVMNADGSDQTRLTSNAAADEFPTWLPDGNRIGFDSARDGNYEVYVMNADGSGVSRLTYDPTRDWDAAWSPDGQRIAFTCGGQTANAEICIMDSDGSHRVNLTNYWDRDMEPAWSPDGRRIAFMSVRDGYWSILVMNADGSGQTRLTEGEVDLSPAWSSDGQRIAFTSRRSGWRQIYTMNADGSGLVRLTNHQAHDYSPTWSPDGRRIAFVSERDGNAEIYVMNADGSGQTRLTSNQTSDDAPAWSPR